MIPDSSTTSDAPCWQVVVTSVVHAVILDVTFDCFDTIRDFQLNGRMSLGWCCTESHLLLPFQRLETGIILFCVRFDDLLRRFRKILDKTTYSVSKTLFAACVGLPGEPANNASAGTTVFGGIMVLSAIFAQSLIMVNLPCPQVNASKVVRIRIIQ